MGARTIATVPDSSCLTAVFDSQKKIGENGRLRRPFLFLLAVKNGRLVEQGTHDELLANDGLYASLYGVQA